MFERKKSPPPQKRIDSLIGAGTTLHGDIVFTGGLRIDGELPMAVIWQTLPPPAELRPGAQTARFDALLREVWGNQWCQLG